MEEKIKEVQEYFKQKMLKGEFQTAKITDHCLTLVIDDSYKFTLWIANELNYVKTYAGDYNLMDIPFSSKEAKIMKAILSPIVENYNKKEGLRIKREAYNKLAEELGQPIIEE